MYSHTLAETDVVIDSFQFYEVKNLYFIFKLLVYGSVPSKLNCATFPHAPSMVGRI